MYTITVYLGGVVQLVIRKRPELDTVNPPGCIRNDITLGDYVARKQEYMREEAKKLSFDEWSSLPEVNLLVGNIDELWILLEECWNAAQRNK